MTYNPAFKVFYIKDNESPTENNRLVPAPKISINPEYYYANNIVVGYTYAINIDGYATSIDLRNFNNNTTPGFVDVIDSIQRVKNIFNNNGGALVITNSEDIPVLKASGTIIRSLEFNESDNKWNNYAPYAIELEANDIITSNCSGLIVYSGCNTIPSGISISPEFIDMKKYRIKSFDDNWTFDLNENIYNSYQFLPSGNFNNENFNISYSIKAVGKHYFVNGKLLPAWEQAKNFCQYRLYNQINNLINNVLPVSTGDVGCSGMVSLTNIFSAGDINTLSSLSINQYKIFNEKINIETSETEGSFGLTYDAILKRTAPTGIDFIDTNTIHTFEVAKNISDEGNSKNITITIQGNIQGLIEGGLIESSGLLSLPKYGQILLSSSSGISKYDSAISCYNKLISNNKLKDNFANMLGVSNSGLGVSGICIDPTGVPLSNSHSCTHDYHNGTINYTSTYDSNRAIASQSSYSNITIAFQDSVPQIAEFIIPGRSKGPIIQNIDCDTPKKITINIDGAVPPGYLTTCCPTFESLLENSCNGSIVIPNLPPEIIANTVITENRQNYSTDGSFSLTRSYIYYDPNP